MTGSKLYAHAVAAIKRSLRLHYPGRELLILPDDVFLVSFPKSGNTWARFLIANLVHPDVTVTFANIHALIPDPAGTASRIFDRMSGLRIIKSHECFEPRYPRAIYIVRDPRDVVVSQYHYHRKRKLIEDDSPIEKFVARFLAGKTCAHGSWAENVSTWLVARRDDPRFLLLRYEEMVSDTPRELAKIASFLGISASPQRLSEAAARSSANQMREMEKKQAHLNTLTKGARQDISFVRAAGSGGWRKELPEHCVAEMESAWSGVMRELGYELHQKSLIETGH